MARATRSPSCCWAYTQPVRLLGVAISYRYSQGGEGWGHGGVRIETALGMAVPQSLAPVATPDGHECTPGAAREISAEAGMKLAAEHDPGTPTALSPSTRACVCQRARGVLSAQTRVQVNLALCRSFCNFR